MTTSLGTGAYADAYFIAQASSSAKSTKAPKPNNNDSDKYEKDGILYSTKSGKIIRPPGECGRHAGGTHSGFILRTAMGIPDKDLKDCSTAQESALVEMFEAYQVREPQALCTRSGLALIPPFSAS